MGDISFYACMVASVELASGVGGASRSCWLLGMFRSTVRVKAV